MGGCGPPPSRKPAVLERSRHLAHIHGALRRQNLLALEQSPSPGPGTRRNRSLNPNTNAPLATLYEIGLVVMSSLIVIVCRLWRRGQRRAFGRGKSLLPPFPPLSIFHRPQSLFFRRFKGTNTPPNQNTCRYPETERRPQPKAQVPTGTPSHSNIDGRADSVAVDSLNSLLLPITCRRPSFITHSSFTVREEHKR